MMFKTDRRVRVAKAIGDEMFYQRHGFMPEADADDLPEPNLLMVAQIAILAADGELEAIDKMRIQRDRMAAALLAPGECLIVGL